MKGIVSDVNIQGQVDFLVAVMRAEPWKLFWNHLQLSYCHFADIGLSADASDTLVWETCQHEELVLITDNRNRNDADSLEAAIRLFNTPQSLPVFTISNVPRLRRSRTYADRVIDRLLDAVTRIEMLRGTGRLYLP